MKKFNENEKEFITKLKNIMPFVKGELELNCCNGDWYAFDYREELSAAFPMERFNLPLISDKMAKIMNIDIVKCCDFCDVYHAG